MMTKLRITFDIDMTREVDHLQGNIAAQAEEAAGRLIFKNLEVMLLERSVHTTAYPVDDAALQEYHILRLERQLAMIRAAADTATYALIEQ
jgi:hypothetical protein